MWTPAAVAGIFTAAAGLLTAAATFIRQVRHERTCTCAAPPAPKGGA